MNDIESRHSFEYTFLLSKYFIRLTVRSCITISGPISGPISGLASHPFGSWQSRQGDKTFMWIRNILSKHLQGVRSIIYGYDTKLGGSQSFQLIPDLAQALINQLQTYGWNSTSAKPIVFLAHSLGGLVLREAMVKLDRSPNEKHTILLSLFVGAVFFGVPNLGMEQSQVQTIVDDNQMRHWSTTSLEVPIISADSTIPPQIARSRVDSSVFGHTRPCSLPLFWSVDPQCESLCLIRNRRMQMVQ
jgi:hypothetical protein